MTPEERKLELIWAKISEIWVPVIKNVTPEEKKLEQILVGISEIHGTVIKTGRPVEKNWRPSEPRTGTYAVSWTRDNRVLRVGQLDPPSSAL